MQKMNLLAIILCHALSLGKATYASSSMYDAPGASWKCKDIDGGLHLIVYLFEDRQGNVVSLKYLEDGGKGAMPCRRADESSDVGVEYECADHHPRWGHSAEVLRPMRDSSTKEIHFHEHGYSSQEAIETDLVCVRE